MNYHNSTPGSFGENPERPLTNGRNFVSGCLGNGASIVPASAVPAWMLSADDLVERIVTHIPPANAPQGVGAEASGGFFYEELN